MNPATNLAELVGFCRPYRPCYLTRLLATLATLATLAALAALATLAAFAFCRARTALIAL